MFEKVAVAPTTEKDDPGSIAEALLFYNEVNLILDPGSLAGLVRRLGIDGFLLLIKETPIKVICYQEMPCIHTQYGAMSFSGIIFGPTDVQQNLEWTLNRITERRGKSRRAAKQIAEICSFLKRSDDFIPNCLFEDAAFEDFQNQSFVSRAILKFLASVAPSYPINKGHSFIVRKENDRGRPRCFNIHTDIDFEYLNRAVRLKYPNYGGELNATNLAGRFFSAYGDLVPTIKLRCPLLTSEQTSSLIVSRLEHNVYRYVPERRDEEVFQQAIFGQGRSIREAVNSGEKTIMDVIRLLNKADKFKKWINGLDDDASLIGEYIDSINTISWIESLPAKSVRFLTVLGTSVIHPAVGVATGVVDGFLLDSLLKGWRPSVFVNGPLMEFVGEPSKGRR